MNINIIKILALIVFYVFGLSPAFNYSYADETISEKISDTLVSSDDTVLDLSQWDILENSTTNINGNWNFYWKQLLTPNDFLMRDGNDLSSQKVPFEIFWLRMSNKQIRLRIQVRNKTQLR